MKVFTNPIFITLWILFVVVSIIRLSQSFFVNYNSEKWSVSSTFLLVGIVFQVIPLLLLVYKLSSLLNESYKVNEKMSSYTERIFSFTESFMDNLNHPYSVENLRKDYLTKSSIFLYYVDLERINDLYRSEFGRDEQVSKIEESVDKKEAGVTGSAANIVSANLVSGKQLISKNESTIFSKSPSEKVLDWQTAFLRNEKITIGLEKTVKQITQNIGNGNHALGETTSLDENIITALDEGIRLRSNKGFVLIKAPFTIMFTSDASGEYELTYRHPLSDESQNPENQYLIRVSLLEDQLSRQTILYFQKYINSSIEFYVLGNIVTVKNSVSDVPNIIEVLPLAIYT